MEDDRGGFTLLVMMKTMLSLMLVLSVLLPGRVLGEEEGKAKARVPVVEVYEIRKYEEGVVKSPETVLELSNPTERTYYISLDRRYDMEVLSEGKWMLAWWPDCDAGLGYYPLRPGAKDLISVRPTWDEEACRFRLYFYTLDEDRSLGKMVSVRSRMIRRDELGENKGSGTRTEGREYYKVPMTDEEENKQRGKTADDAERPSVTQEKDEGGKVERPAVRVYASAKDFGLTLLEISNPTERTFYFRGNVVTQPFRNLEVMRGEKWINTWLWEPVEPGSEVYPLKAGAKMLVSADPPRDEVSRFRFFFYTKRDVKEGEVFSVWSPAIDPRELGEHPLLNDISTKDAEVKEPLTDAELNRKMKAEGEKKQD